MNPEGMLGLLKEPEREKDSHRRSNTSTPADCYDLCRVGLQDKVSLQDNCRGEETVDQSDSNTHLYIGSGKRKLGSPA